MTNVVIIGTGQGGYQLAASLRQEGFDGAITMIGDESGLPYQRPPLSKDYLNHGDADRLSLRPAAFYADNQIDIMDNTRVVSIDREAQLVKTTDGAKLAYDHLVLATGSRNRIPPIQGVTDPDVISLRTLADAQNISERLDQMQKVTVIGGGFIGLEFAAVAAARGIAVTVIEGAEALMGRAVSAATSAHFLQAHKDWGVNVVFGHFAKSIDISGDQANVQLSDGTVIAGDTVLVAAGVEANQELAVEAGLTVDNGIVVDAQLLTSDPNISALGDCCRFIEPLRGLSARLESVQAATDHARTIAARLVGKPQDYWAVPWFWSNQADRKLQIAGYSVGADDWYVVEDGAKLSVYCFAEEKLVAVETVNNAGVHMAARRLLGKGGSVTRADLAAVDYALKALI